MQREEDNAEVVHTKLRELGAGDVADEFMGVLEGPPPTNKLVKISRESCESWPDADSEEPARWFEPGIGWFKASVPQKDRGSSIMVNLSEDQIDIARTAAERDFWVDWPALDAMDAAIDLAEKEIASRSLSVDPDLRKMMKDMSKLISKNYIPKLEARISEKGGWTEDSPEKQIKIVTLKSFLRAIQQNKEESARKFENFKDDSVRHIRDYGDLSEDRTGRDRARKERARNLMFYGAALAEGGRVLQIIHTRLDEEMEDYKKELETLEREVSADDTQRRELAREFPIRHAFQSGGAERAARAEMPKKSQNKSKRKSQNKSKRKSQNKSKRKSKNKSKTKRKTKRIKRKTTKRKSTKRKSTKRQSTKDFLKKKIDKFNKIT